MDNPLVERLKSYYDNYGNIDLDQLDTLYSDDIVFKDPVHEVRGLVAFQHYLAELNVNLTYCRFEYLDQIVSTDAAYLKWNMHFRHLSLGNKDICVRGISQLQYGDRIYYHEDAYDLGAMIYEHIPVFGFITRKLKSRLEN